MHFTLDGPPLMVEQKKVINQTIIQLQKENNALRKANEKLKKELVENQKYTLLLERVNKLQESIELGEG